MVVMLSIALYHILLYFRWCLVFQNSRNWIYWTLPKIALWCAYCSGLFGSCVTSLLRALFWILFCICCFLNCAECVLPSQSYQLSDACYGILSTIMCVSAALFVARLDHSLDSAKHTRMWKYCCTCQVGRGTFDWCFYFWFAFHSSLLFISLFRNHAVFVWWPPWSRPESRWSWKLSW